MWHLVSFGLMSTVFLLRSEDILETDDLTFPNANMSKAAEQSGTREQSRLQECLGESSLVEKPHQPHVLRLVA